MINAPASLARLWVTAFDLPQLTRHLMRLPWLTIQIKNLMQSNKVSKILFVLIMTIFTLTACSIVEYAKSSTFARTLYHNFSNIDDYKKFPFRTLHPGGTPFHFSIDMDSGRFPKTISVDKEPKDILRFLEETKTIAFIAIKDNKIIFEKYLDGYSKDSLIMSFSVTKSFISALIGCAIEEGIIQSTEQSVTDFIPELAANGFDKVKIKHVLQMTSGLDYAENDNPFGIHSRSYQRAQIIETILNFKLKEEPGKTFEYKSGDTLIAGLVLARALKSRTITDYLQEKIWTPVGMETKGLWSTYEDDIEKTFCCLSGTARDFAKFGRLYLNGGRWGNQQVIPESWVKLSTKLDKTEGSPWFYQYGWYVMSEKYGDFRAEGVRGQFIYVNPSKNLIIVRMGRSLGISWDDWCEVFAELSETVR